MIRNINYRGHVSAKDLAQIDFNHLNCRPPPRQKVIPLSRGKLIVFSSGKCRIMGLREPINPNDEQLLPYQINDLQIQSVTGVFNLGSTVNLIRLARNVSSSSSSSSWSYEPEIFPAVRLTKFNPICVNVFGSGKVVVMGMKSITDGWESLIDDVIASIKAADAY